MRKIFWCCLIAATAVCAAFWAIAYVSQNPDTPLGKSAVAVYQVGAWLNPMHHAAPLTVARLDRSGGGAALADAAEAIPSEPTPVDDPVALLPDPPPAEDGPVASQPAPIIIHDEEDLNAVAGAAGKNEGPAEGCVGVHLNPSTIDLVEPITVAKCAGVPPQMPHCKQDVELIPAMPHAIDDDGDKAADPAGAQPPSYGIFDFWMGFFSGPANLTDASCPCQEDPHYAEHYSGCPHTGGACPPDCCAPNPAVKAAPAVPGGSEDSEDVTPVPAKHATPRLPGNLPGMPPLQQLKSDTMEMRPSDWKPYNLDPGPY